MTANDRGIIIYNNTLKKRQYWYLFVCVLVFHRRTGKSKREHHYVVSIRWVRRRTNVRISHSIGISKFIKLWIRRPHNKYIIIFSANAVNRFSRRLTRSIDSIWKKNNNKKNPYLRDSMFTYIHIRAAVRIGTEISDWRSNAVDEVIIFLLLLSIFFNTDYYDNAIV